MESGQVRKMNEVSQVELNQVQGGHADFSPATWYYVETNPSRPLSEAAIVGLVGAMDAGFEIAPVN